MNRAERRRIEKAQSKTHVITHSQEMYEKGFTDGMRQGVLRESGMTTRLFTTAMAAVLHHEYGFGKKRLDMVLMQVCSTLGTIKDDLDRERRMREWIKRETGIDLDDYTGCRQIDLRQELQDYYDMGRVAHGNGSKIDFNVKDEEIPIQNAKNDSGAK